ncbi:ribonuclease H family protein [Clostridium sp. SHJSY1]|uniref:ribonuclease H family protein n=1 Tax=Clostridium sp. SHJSY1 TaxID=2942483 RepID=UPI0028765407|nr:ribonuclease H family protein [Clostridium sp. SHJSY1]MDS0525081.1 ribonuclease H family protein [Clostridium sp. SHJSY1]
MAKYYSVYRGKSGVSKILTSWEECKEEVIGCKGAIYKSFKTESEAIEFLSLNSKGKCGDITLKSESEEKSIIDDSNLVIYVDGSFSLEKSNYSYGLVAIKDKEVVYEDNGVGEDQDAIALRNVAGEVLGASRAVEYAILKGYKEVTIVYDYQGIECWALGTWKRNKELTIAYHKLMQENMKKISIKFIKVKGHSGDKYNDIADQLAKKALEIIS